MNLHKEVEAYIINNNVEDAFQALKTAAQNSKQGNLSDDLVLLEGRYTHWKQNRRRGIQTIDDITEINKIKAILLELAKEIMVVLPSTSDKPASPEQPVPNGSNKQPEVSKIFTGNIYGTIADHIGTINYYHSNQHNDRAQQTIPQSTFYKTYYLSLLKILKNDIPAQLYLSDLQDIILTTEWVLETDQEDGRTQFAALVTAILQKYTTAIETADTGLSKNALQLLLNQVSNLKTLALSTSNNRAEIGTQLQSIAYSIRRRATQADDFTALLHLVSLFEQWNQNLIK